MKLGELIAPMSVATFAERHWGARAVALSERADRFAGVAFDFDELRRHVRARPRAMLLKAQFFDRTGGHREMEIVPGQIGDCFDAGMTICFSNVGAVLPELAAEGRSLARSIAFRGQTSFAAYWSPPGAGFGLHYDDHDVFILQLRGAKRWRYSRVPATPSPRENFVYTPEGATALRARGVDVREPTEDDLASALLRPGDLLYLPAGTWHRTIAEASESLALTLRVSGGGVADVIGACVHAWLGADAATRRALPIGAADDAARATVGVIEERLASFRTFVARLTADDLLAACAREEK